MDAETKDKSGSFTLFCSRYDSYEYMLSTAASGIVDLSDAELTVLGFLGEGDLRASWTVHL